MTTKGQVPASVQTCLCTCFNLAILTTHKLTYTIHDMDMWTTHTIELVMWWLITRHWHTIHHWRYMKCTSQTYNAIYTIVILSLTWFPNLLKGIAVSVTTTANWMGNFIIALITPLLLNSLLHTYGTFYVLSACLLLAILFVLLTLPETKVRTLTCHPTHNYIHVFIYVYMNVHKVLP